MAKSSRLEVRQLRTASDNNNTGGGTDTFPVVLEMPLNGRLTALEPLRVPSLPTSAVFMLQDRNQYAVISYGTQQQQQQSDGKISPYPVQTHASGSLQSNGGGRRVDDVGPTLVAVDPRCIALQAFDGLLTVIPVDPNYTPPLAGSSHHPRRPKPLLGAPFHCRIEEHTVLDIAFVPQQPPPPTAAAAPHRRPAAAMRRPCSWPSCFRTPAGRST